MEILQFSVQPLSHCSHHSFIYARNITTMFPKVVILSNIEPTSWGPLPSFLKPSLGIVVNQKNMVWDMPGLWTTNSHNLLGAKWASLVCDMVEHTPSSDIPETSNPHGIFKWLSSTCTPSLVRIGLRRSELSSPPPQKRRWLLESAFWGYDKFGSVYNWSCEN